MLLVSMVATLALAQTPAPAVDPATLGPRVGQAIPAFEAKDRDGVSRDFRSLTGRNGLVLVFFRSADW